MNILNSIARYALVGIVNTIVHWFIFFICLYFIVSSQAICNSVAFLISVTVSFFLNAHFTFKAHTNVTRYILFTGFMGIISFTTGFIADKVSLSPFLTLIIFTILSFMIGFIWSNYWVFKK